MTSRAVRCRKSSAFKMMLRPPAAVLHGREHKAQFLLGMRAVGLSSGEMPICFKRKRAARFSSRLNGYNAMIKPVQRIRRPQRDGQRLLDRQPFRRKFAGDDAQKCQHAETDGEARCDLNHFRSERRTDQKWREQREKIGSPSQPRPRLAIVMPSCVALK